MTNVQQATEAALAVIQREEGLVTQDDVVKALDLCQNPKAVVRELDAQIEAAVIQWINQNGDIEVGDIRYYVGTEKTTKCIDPRRTLEAVFDAVGADFDSFLGTLVSQPFKPATTRTIVGDDVADSLFVTSTQEDVKTGKPRKRLQVSNEKFGKKRQHTTGVTDEL